MRKTTLGGVAKESFAPDVRAVRNKRTQPTTNHKTLNDNQHQPHPKLEDDAKPLAQPQPTARTSAEATTNDKRYNDSTAPAPPAKTAAYDDDADSSAHPRATVNTEHKDDEDSFTHTNSRVGDGADHSDTSWLLAPDAPIALPLRPYPVLKGTNPSGGGAASPLRPSSRASPAPRAASPHGSQQPRAGAFPSGSSAAALLCDGPHQLPPGSERLLFLQMPMQLPIRHTDSGDAAAPSQPQTVGAAEYLETLAGGGGSVKLAGLLELPPGELGELRFHRSGKVVLQIGDFRFDVQQGTECSFDQELVLMRPAPTGGGAPGDPVELQRLGKFHTRMVASPDVGDLLSRRAREALSEQAVHMNS